MNQNNYCYIIVKGNHTYCGATNNLTRRLKQHNGTIGGGAKYTRRFGKDGWQYLGTISGFVSRSQCLSFEWHVKHVRLQRAIANPKERRATQIATTIQQKKWCARHLPCPTALHVEWFDADTLPIVNNALLAANIAPPVEGLSDAISSALPTTSELTETIVVQIPEVVTGNKLEFESMGTHRSFVEETARSPSPRSGSEPAMLIGWLSVCSTQ